MADHNSFSELRKLKLSAEVATKNDLENVLLSANTYTNLVSAELELEIESKIKSDIKTQLSSSLSNLMPCNYEYPGGDNLSIIIHNIGVLENSLFGLMKL